MSVLGGHELRALSADYSDASHSTGSTPGPLYADTPSSTPYDDLLPEGRQPVGNWNASPRWSTIQGDGCIVVDQAAEAGAGNMNVEKCSSGQNAEQMPADRY